MLSEEQIRIARSNFMLAAKDFGFEFESPFTPTDGLEVFGYITNYGSKNGTVICLTSPSDWQSDKAVFDWCKEMNCFCSVLNIEHLLGEYKRSYFREMLRDWGKYNT
ncbi:MAG: hypothetical protein IIU77_01000 [Clostridia bacterium]|nr:hypothetical protein [Clostridia bacterium]